jgi:hypothetical protein
MTSLIRPISEQYAAIAGMPRPGEDANDTERRRRKQAIDAQWKQLRCAQRTALEAFAELNGWRAAKTAFSPEQLVKGAPGSRVGWTYDSSLFDHGEYLRAVEKPYRPVAIVAHLYGDNRDQTRAGALALRLIAHFPPFAKASWYYPGRCVVVCYTRPDTEVKWLPEQIKGPDTK